MKVEDFYNHMCVDDESGCWVWTRARRWSRGGYGVAYILGKEVLAHRASYEISKGPIPPGKFVCHSCDNPPCVNPDHLWIGTHQENVDDSVRKGRNSSPPIQIGDSNPSRRFPEKRKRGEAHPLSKGTPELITAIRRAYIAGESLTGMAARFDVKGSFVQDVVYGRVWQHLFGVDGSPALAELQAVKRSKPNAKITQEVAAIIRTRLDAGGLGKDLAVEFGVHKATISDIKRRKIWA